LKRIFLKYFLIKFFCNKIILSRLFNNVTFKFFVILVNFKGCKNKYY